ncbi:MULTISPECIES: carbonic anhydrase [unclassified Brenneria]|uniref:carbonic anhydrase n=1 Tax=unclassified Brenneria TaxID=2634434 RepID=UPI0015559B1A|nr:MULTISPECIES: carbonic anhydrase family protein [unclassified Brenneria]MBJ7222511.1 carbonic anhydrase family protein [Brenneria sp. L3-3C-1]MEE3643754.1 carbonic anhydrase family protein [Brenneria sp. L3_3C_1]MEE3651482.1 carbonic anhydrase family protein [Brenneria sp. HEZEL_4_2_4]NPD01438.1 carbonic anhydrase family protein [Brenneria sp. hezel4-2-4]
MKYTLLASLAFTACFSLHAAEHAHWSYEGQEAPPHWGKLSPDFSLCDTGKNQSPIDIHGALKTVHDGLQLSYQTGAQHIVNNGHTIQVDVSANDTLVMDDDTFALQQFHFHAPSENEIDGKAFPLEAHFVYQDQQGALTVVALMFAQGDANQELEKAWQQLPSTLNKPVLLTAPLNINALIPSTYQQSYYRFSGSLTTPPCSEGVRWLVLDKPATISADQIARFTAAVHHANNRPVQPLNGRVIIN